MFGKYAHGKLIPEWVQNAPKEYIQEFINGYMKADGNIRENGGLQLTTVSLNLAFGLQRLYLKLGHIFSINKTIRPKTCVIEGRTVNQRDTYCIRGVLKREKNVSAFIEDNYVWYPPSKITKKEVTETNVYNFEVDIDNSYIVENTIVHNCQSYSIAGKRDKNDPRNALFMEYVKYLDYFQPKAFIMENVIGMLSKKTANGEKVIDIIMEHLNKNYNCIINRLYASDFEVPQNRRRTIIIGIRKDLNIIPKEPVPVIASVKDRIPVKSVLLPRAQIDAKNFLSERAIQGILNKKEKSKEKGAGFGAQYLDLEKPSYTIPARYWKDGYDALVKYSDTEIRRLTIIELKRIQSFPDDYIIEGSKKDIIMQIGNAVACKFAYHLGKYITSTLK
jgi:DNA-cytosine methyltransferase